MSLKISGVPWRLVELELYLRAPGHEDAFVHRDPRQARRGWYLHRQGGTLKSGTYKGLDLCLGGAGSRCGLLLRAVEDPDGQLIEGPSKVVDALIAATGSEDLKALDRALDNADPENTTDVMYFDRRSDSPPVVYSSSRIGLTLKREAQARWPWWHLPYRLLTEPRRLKHGRPQLACGMAASGRSDEDIEQLLGRSARPYLAAWREGLQRPDPSPWLGEAPDGVELARSIGAWQAAHPG